MSQETASHLNFPKIIRKSKNFRLKNFFAFQGTPLEKLKIEVDINNLTPSGCHRYNNHRQTFKKNENEKIVEL